MAIFLRIVLGLLCLVTCLPATCSTEVPDLKGLYTRYSQNPTDENISRVLEACRKGGALDFDGDLDLLKGLPIVIGLAEARTVNHSFQILDNCTDGASKLALRTYLGTHVMERYPEATIAALHRQKHWKRLAKDLVKSEPEEFFLIECKTLECVHGKHTALRRKRRALIDAKIPHDQEIVRATLLSHFDLDDDFLPF